MYLNELLLFRGYRLSNCIDQYKTWPTSLNYFTIVSFCNVLDCSILCFDVLFCSLFDYSILNFSVLWHIVLVRSTDFRTALKTEKPTFLNYSTNWSYYSFLDCRVLYFDVLLCITLNCSVFEGIVTWVGYRISDCLEQLNTWPTSLNYSTIVFYCTVLYFDVLLCSTLDCSALECIVRKCTHIVKHRIYPHYIKLL